MTIRTLSRIWALLPGLWGAAACAGNPSLAARQSPSPSPGVLDSLPEGVQVRLALHGRRVEGLLVRTAPDSLTLREEGGLTSSFARAELDTVWARGNSYRATKVGAIGGLVLGLVTAGIAAEGGSSASDAEAVGLLAIPLAIGVGVGALIDLATPAPWHPIYQR